MPEPDPYATLGVPRTASREEIARAYRQLAKQYHPDAGASPTPTMSRINEAWRTLSDPGRRAAWDRAHTVLQPAHWAAAPAKPMQRPPPQPSAPASRRESGMVAVLVIAGVAVLVGAVMIGVRAALGPAEYGSNFTSDEISFTYEPGWTLYPGDPGVVDGRRVVAHLSNGGLQPDDLCAMAGVPCMTASETMSDGQAAIVITAWSEGTPPEPEPVTSRPFGLDADGIVGGQPAVLEVTHDEDLYSVWWQLSPSGFPDRWIEVRADFRAAHQIDSGRIFQALHNLLNSVEFES